MCMDQIIELSKALLTPVVAVVAAYVAWQQLKTNRRKLKLDLFDRRYVVFEKIGEFIGSILTSGTVQPGKEIQFLVIPRRRGCCLGTTSLSSFLRSIERLLIFMRLTRSWRDQQAILEPQTSRRKEQSKIGIAKPLRTYRRDFRIT